MFISITFTGNSIDETNKTAESQRLKIYIQYVHHSRGHMHSNDYAIAESLPWWWCGPSASNPTADVLSSPSHHGSANGRPSLEGYPRWCSPATGFKSGELGGHISGGIKSGISLCRMVTVTCTVNGMISVTSTLHHQVKDVHSIQRSKFTSMISIHLQSYVPKIIKIRAYL